MAKPFISEQKVTTGYVGGFLSIVVPLLFVVVYPDFFNSERFLGNMMVWICALGAVLIAVEWFSKTKFFFESPRQRNIGPHQHSLAKRAAMRSLGWAVVISFVCFLYAVIPHYQGAFFQRFYQVGRFMLLAWAVAVFPYYWFTLRKISGFYWDRKDPSLLIHLFLRRLFVERNKKLWSVFTASRSVRSAWLGVVVKAFYLPLMTTFLFNNTNEFVNNFAGLLQSGSSENPLSGFEYQKRFYHFVFSGAFLADVTLVVLGYALTLRWIDNGIRSVEHTALGWALALACYMPFNGFTNSYIKWPSHSFFEFESGALKFAIMAVILVLVCIYAWATLAFGLRFSNLTNRGILNTGPYAYVRHPAYASKVLVWWLEHLPAFTFAFSLQDFIGMSGWTLIYFGRALTEERHLSLDPDYRLYKQQVPYRFIPGVY